MAKKTPPSDHPTTPAISDELDQLLSSLKLSRIRQIIAQQLQAATQSQPAYSDFLVGLLREEFLYRQHLSIEYRIRQSRLPERLALETFPFKKQPSINSFTWRSSLSKARICLSNRSLSLPRKRMFFHS